MLDQLSSYSRVVSTSLQTDTVGYILGGTVQLLVYYLTMTGSVCTKSHLSLKQKSITVKNSELLINEV